VSFLDYQALLFLGFCVKQFLGYLVVIFLDFLCCKLRLPQVKLKSLLTSKK